MTLAGEDPIRQQYESNPNLAQRSADAARNLARLAFVDILFFFGVLFVGFAYLWKRGDLAWVRSTSAEQPEAPAAGARPEARELESAGKLS